MPDGALSSVSKESSDDACLLGPADVSQLFTGFPGSASVNALVESSNDLGVWEVLAPVASGPSLESILEDCALLALSDELSNDLSISGTLANDRSEAWSDEELALSAVLDEVSDDSVLGSPADSSELLVLLPNSALFVALSVSSVNLGAGPVASPVAGSPLSETSLVLDALLALSHPDSDDSSSADFLWDALGEDSALLLILGADVVILDPSFHDLGSPSFVASGRLASGELDVSSLVNGALVFAFLESSNRLVGGAWCHASAPLLVALLELSAGGTLRVLVLSNDDLSEWVAHLSGFLRRFPDRASVAAVLVSLDDSGVLHVASPLALSGLDGSSLGDCAVLETSLESVHDLAWRDSGGSASGDASGPSALSKTSGLAVSVALLELLDKSGTHWDLSLGLSLALSSGHNSVLIGFADQFSLLLSIDKLAESERVSYSTDILLGRCRQQGAAQHAHDNRKISHFNYKNK